MKVANALSTADRKSIWLMVKNRHQRLGRNAQKKPAPFVPQQHRYGDVNEQSPELWKTQNQLSRSRNVGIFYQRQKSLPKALTGVYKVACLNLRMY